VSAGVFDGLLDPVAGDAPAGADLRWTPIWDEIETARRDETDDLPRGVWEVDVKAADWSRVVTLCRDALATRGKDLRLACRLVEAAARRDGPAALGAGLRFLAAFCEASWSAMHPEHDGTADSPRLAPLEWLDGALALAASLAPLAVAETETGPRTLTASDHAAARRREAATRAGGSTKAGRGWIAVAQFDAAMDRAPLADIEALIGAFEGAQAAAVALEAALVGLAGDAAPAFVRLRAAADDALALLRPALARRPRPVAPPASSPSPALAAEIAMINDAIDGPRRAEPESISDRDEAYAALARIAALLRRIEPHSLTPYLLERAVRWGAMSAPEVLSDLTRGGKDPEMMAWLLKPRGDKTP
jgi:type VI secretion system ImpA family protein